jgi:hypothetical protein
MDGRSGKLSAPRDVCGKPRYFTADELAVIHPQVSAEEVSNRAWEYFSSRAKQP